jgi:hypothetical protein
MKKKLRTPVLVTLCSCDKIVEKIREEGFILLLSFKVFSPRSLGSIASGPMCGEADVVEQCLTSFRYDREEERHRERKREERERENKIYTSKALPQ